MTPAQEGERACRRDNFLMEAMDKLIQAKELTHKEEYVADRAVSNAMDWLDDLLNPLTEEEMAVWEEIGQGYCIDRSSDFDSSDINEVITDSERRKAVQSELEARQAEADEKLTDILVTG